MTQALNLANFANNLNTSGATTNAGLQNSSVTVTAGTGMSGGGAVALGSSVTLTNAGVTSVTGAGTVSVSASTGSVTITGTGGSGTVTSVATGNGLQGGTITSSGTLSVACPSFNTVGSYVCAFFNVTGGAASISSGGTVSAGGGNLQLQSIEFINGGTVNNLSGTWRWMSAPNGTNAPASGIACRVS
jgi:mucin-19